MTRNHSNIVIILLGSILAVSVVLVSAMYKNSQEQLNQLGNAINEVIVADKDIDVFCQTKANTPASFQAYAMFDLRKKLRNSVKELVKQRDALGKIISQDNFLETAAFVCWNKQRLAEGMKLCEFKHKNVKSMDAWQEQLLQHVSEDKQRHQQGKFIIKDAINLVESFFSPQKALSEQSYQAPTC